LRIAIDTGGTFTDCVAVVEGEMGDGRMSGVDAVELAVFQSAVHSIAEEMGAALRRTAISPNIEERRDYSCALFDAEHRVIAMGDHMPVHLGSMPMSVEAAVRALGLERGDVAILNDPYAGGTHLPDITMVMGVFADGEGVEPLPASARDMGHPGSMGAPVFYVAARAHHADVGGMFAGSMGPAREIFQEGLRIPPVKLVRAGVVDEGLMAMVLLNVRTPAEREGDLAAQIGACRVGEQRLLGLVERYGVERLRMLGEELLNYSERLVRAEVRGLPSGIYEAEDFLDEDGVTEERVRIAVKISVDAEAGAMGIDFAGTSGQVQGSVNAVRAITLSACFYVLRCLLGEDAPATAGILRPLTLRTEAGSVVDALPPRAVAGGNVETSQRIVDVLLRALALAAPKRVPAASAGTMSNLTIGGVDGRTGAAFTYYETTAGGMGASATGDGLSGVQTHMTNSLNTPVEALEFAYPLRMRRYGYRRGSGGEGRHRGGDGLVKELEMLCDAEVTLLADRRVGRPYGLSGGGEGVAGLAALREDEDERVLPGKCSVRVKRGAVLRLESPGGGGFGSCADGEGFAGS
jgi:N-methylhydantoinase B